MDKSAYLKILFWFLGIVVIIIFYIITNNKVQTLIGENAKLGDSLKVLRKNIDELDSLLHIIPSDLIGKFDTVAIEKSDSVFIYKFVPKDNDAKSYSWDFDDGQKSKDKEPEHKFYPVKKSTYEVVLIVNKNNKSKEDKLKIVLPAVTQVTVKLDSNSFCKQNQGVYKFILKPTGGIVTGNGVRREKNNDYYFQPSDKNVKIGKNTFTYKYNQQTASFQVNVKDCTDSVKISIKLKTNQFCVQDSNGYKFTVRPKDCKVYGTGVESKNGEYYFYPSKVRPGEIKFTGEYSGKKTSYSVKVNNCPNSQIKKP